MFLTASIFFKSSLPNSTTWFYFSMLLAVALFFKFSRFLSVRNWDIVTVFVLVPGLLVLQQAHEQQQAPAVAAVVVGVAGQALAGPASGLSGVAALASASDMMPSPLLWVGYLWLVCGSIYLLIRCLIDLILIRRPALAPNLNFGGLAFFGGALFICLVVVAFQQIDKRMLFDPNVNLALDVENGASTGGKEGVLLQLALRPFKMWVILTFAMCCHLAVVVGLIVIGVRHFQGALTGMAAATCYLLLPYTGLHVGQVHHVWPIALIVWAIASYRIPILAGMFLGLAAGTSTIYFPVLLFPLWLSFYRRCGSGRFAVAFVLSAGLALAITGVVIAWNADLGRSINETIELTDWQPWLVPNVEGLWTNVHWAYRIPIFIAYVTFVLLTVLWPAPKNLAHLIALSAAILIGIQFWFADKGGVYVLWYLPLFLLMAFRPNLSDRFPIPIHPETDWLSRSGRAVKRFVGRLVRLPEPLVKVR
jgi:hypothetical protein